MVECDTLNTEVNNISKIQFSSRLSKKGVLLVLSSNFLGASFVVGSRDSVIGRGNGCDFIIKDPLISKEHCRITVDENEKFFIEDLLSTNSTFINGKELKKKIQLTYGDRITMGKTILRFFLEEKSDN
ncbi:MAG TPA: FHA domain-containing protein [Spirochaetota bacterium]|jgi:pSer/pThr/pTyr-binding forkhead associated (FHA) protein|nr:MAG: FHA domain-containing protein FhaB [Spirochaetes bacterium ADurb.Bin133]HNZ26359.1 FHA domain-containing protein [Spirochaetota bacterium]HOF01207.1 FHA domain-containing protein [Spirochaetota bacterium]HOS32854.1 FHA domain-containing protein [Spirochaetota bacterium]HOS55315.1 FHA domain-containing protein [Spirochaetota bacterium]